MGTSGDRAGPVLVTGATGFIGSHVTRRLLRAGRRVRVIVRDPRKLAAVGLDADSEQLEVFCGDLLDRAACERAVSGVTRALHIAGAVGTARGQRERLFRLNVETTRTLFSALRDAAVIERVVYLASIFALGDSADGQPVDEQVRWRLDDLGVDGLGVDYVAAKREAELSAWRFCDEGLPLIFAYPCFCYGPGDVYASSSALLELHLRGLLVAAFPGSQNAMDVRDAAAGLIAALDRGRVGERYLLGGENHDYGELGALLASITGLRPPLVTLPGLLVRGGALAGRLVERLHPRPPFDEQAIRLAARHWVYDDGKARRELGHRSRPLVETLREALWWLCRAGRAPWPPGLSR